MIVNLGWSDGGRGELRASDADRDQVRRLLKSVRDERRLDEAEYDRRVDAVRTAKTRADLVRVTVDLPDRKGVRDWVPKMRVRGADREDARGWLAEAAAQGRLTDEEYERRLAALSTVVIYRELKSAIEGLPGWSGTPREYQLAGLTDREVALAALAEAAADGRVAPVEAAILEADIRQARRVGTLDTLVAALADRVSDQERQNTVDALAKAHRDGQLDVVEYIARADQAREAARDAELAPLVADLKGDARRLSESDRQQVADTLERALAEGKLELAEFDERVRAAHAGATTADVAPLVADLANPPRSAKRRWWDTFFDRFVANSALMPAPHYWILKPVWYAAICVTVLAYVYSLFWNWVVAASALWLPLYLLVRMETFVVQEIAAVGERQRAVVEELRVRLGQLRAEQPAIKEIRLVYPVTYTSREDGEEVEKIRHGVAKIDIELTGAALAPRVRDEIIRMLWLSRLYPLDRIWLRQQSPTKNLGTAWLSGTDAKKLRHRYGPRPYGPYQDAQTGAWRPPGRAAP
jgi:hypothetical protein